MWTIQMSAIAIGAMIAICTRMCRSSHQRSHAGICWSTGPVLTPTRIATAHRLTAVPASGPGHWELISDWAGTLADLSAAAALASWDRETLMPLAASDGRARQLGTLAAITHREVVRDDVGEALLALSDESSLTADQAAVVRLGRRRRDRAVRLPEDLVREITEACSRGVSAWLTARRANDYSLFSGPLGDLIALKLREAETLDMGGEHYDALLDEYEPGARTAELEPIFDALRRRVTPLVEEAADLPAVSLPAREWGAEGQVALAHDIAEMVGFDFDGGVIARSEHPFTSSIHRGDVRFTTRVDPASPISSIQAVLHEAGHALYEQGLPEELARTPAHDAPSLGAHESQSRFYENHVGLTAAFWRCIEPAMRRRLPEAMTGIDHEILYRAASVVRPSLIRVEADEVTYDLHIIARFRLELALMRGELAVDDLPGAFADAVHDLLGVRPGNDREGVMQDIHWADGLIGYFPTYTLGNIYAAQLASAADAHVGGLETAIEQGRFHEILHFMRDHVHAHGSRHDTAELMRRATGAELGIDALIAHLRRTHLPG
jgi:carboxypeptidase Taq